MVTCLILALCYGSLWYVAQVDRPPIKAEVHSGKAPDPIGQEHPVIREALPEHPVVREPIASDAPLMWAVCDYDISPKHNFGTEEYRQELRKAKCEGREIR